MVPRCIRHCTTTWEKAAFQSAYHATLYPGVRTTPKCPNINVFNGTGRGALLYESAALPLSYLGLAQKTTLASAENRSQFYRKLCFCGDCSRNALNVRTDTWPSRSRCRTAGTAAATTQYTSRD